MPSENAHSVPFKSVPHIAVEVIIASKQETATLGEGNRSNATYNHVMGVCHQLLWQQSRVYQVSKQLEMPFFKRELINTIPVLPPPHTTESTYTKQDLNQESS